MNDVRDSRTPDVADAEAHHPKRTTAIVDRITTNAHATVVTCDESMRKHFTQID